MNLGRKTGPLLGGIGICLLAQAAVHNLMVYPFWLKNYAPEKVASEGLSPDQFLASVAGFREMIAGILWVRADSFFDEGNYDAILPIIRLVTILDPKQIDVYATGMWHIGYNFTDEESRSDRRYLPSAIALGKEGAKNNPNTYELYFETGWLWFHKIDDDYGQAVSWFKKASEIRDILPARRNLLYKAYERDGQIDMTLNFQREQLEKAQKKLDETGGDPNGAFAVRQQRDTVEANLDNTIVRMAQRGYLAQKGGYFDQGDYDTKPPFDVGFSARITVVDPKILRVEGTWRVLPVGTRLRFILRDADYKGAVPGGLQWDGGDGVKLDPPKEATFLQDQLFVRDQHFDRTIDMSRDPTMYPCVQDKYVLEIYYNPRSAPAHIQDKFGWSGEGMTDKNYLNTDIRKGQRVIFATFELTRDQLLRRGDWEVGAKTPTVTTKGFKERGTTDIKGDIIKVPVLKVPGQ